MSLEPSKPVTHNILAGVIKSALPGADGKSQPGSGGNDFGAAFAATAPEPPAALAEAEGQLLAEDTLEQGVPVVEGDSAELDTLLDALPAKHASPDEPDEDALDLPESGMPMLLNLPERSAPEHSTTQNDARPHDALPHDALPHDARPHDARPHDARPRESMVNGLPGGNPLMAGGMPLIKGGQVSAASDQPVPGNLMRGVVPDTVKPLAGVVSAGPVILPGTPKMGSAPAEPGSVVQVVQSATIGARTASADDAQFAKLPVDPITPRALSALQTPATVPVLTGRIDMQATTHDTSASAPAPVSGDATRPNGLPLGALIRDQHTAPQTSATANLLAGQRADYSANGPKVARALDDSVTKDDKLGHKRRGEFTLSTTLPPAAGARAANPGMNAASLNAGAAGIGPAPLATAEEKTAFNSIVDEIAPEAGLRRLDAGSGPGTVQDVSGTRADRAPTLARQLAEASQLAAQGKQVDLLLDPKDLGRVRISLSHIEGTVSVNILADRPETSDLLRRHLPDLAQEFRDIGYQNPQFAFDQSSSGDANPEHSGASAPPRDEEAAPLPTDQATTARVIIGDRMDIRV